MGEVFFYHLTRTPLEMTLPMLLAKARKAGWRIVVRGRSVDRMTWLDDRLWLGPEDQFDPHGISGGEFDADQPVLLTTGKEIANGAACLMAIDGAPVDPAEAMALARTCILFDGNDNAAVDVAREQWRELTGAGCAGQYWSQESGSWEMKSASG